MIDTEKQRARHRKYNRTEKGHARYTRYAARHPEKVRLNGRLWNYGMKINEKNREWLRKLDAELEQMKQSILQAS